MKIEEKSALLVIDIQQEDFKEMDENNMEAPEWNCIRNAKKVLDIFRAKKLPVIQIKEVHRPDMVGTGWRRGNPLYRNLSIYRLCKADVPY